MGQEWFKKGGWCGVLGAVEGSPGIPGAPAAGPGAERSGPPALIEVVFGYGLRLDGIEFG